MMTRKLSRKDWFRTKPTEKVATNFSRKCYYCSQDACFTVGKMNKDKQIEVMLSCNGCLKKVDDKVILETFI